MPRGLAQLVLRIADLAARGRVRFRRKALHELAEFDLETDTFDLVDVLVKLEPADFDCSLVSERTGEWLHVFKPHVAATRIYLKLAIREGCVVISFHEAHRIGEDHEEEQ